MANLDRDVVEIRLERLLDELDSIARVLPGDAATYAAKSHEGRRYELEHRLHIALQAMIDVSFHVATAAGARDLATYAEAVDELRRQRVIDAELADDLVDAVGLRNALVHEYLELDHESVFRTLSSGERLESFARSVFEWMEARGD